MPARKPKPYDPPLTPMEREVEHILNRAAQRMLNERERNVDRPFKDDADCENRSERPG